MGFYKVVYPRAKRVNFENPVRDAFGEICLFVDGKKARSRAGFVGVRG